MAFMSESTLQTSKMAWANPEVETVAPGVHRIPLPLPMDGLTAVNVYALETSEGLLLIDGGWNVPEGRSRLEQSLAEIGFKPQDIVEVLVTHVHRDHYTLASNLQHEFGTRVWLGEGERDSLEMLQQDAHNSTLASTLLNQSGADHLVEAFSSWLGQQQDYEHAWHSPSDWLAKETLLERGDVTLRAVPTPGHTKGHYVFIDEDRRLIFSGDHILPTITPSVGFESARNEHPLADFLDSLQRVAEFGDLSLMPSHGPVGMSSKDRALALIDHHEERLQQILEQVDDGETAYKVASDLTWTKRAIALSELDPFSRALAVMEVDHHLELLQTRGIVSSREIGGVRFYFRAA